MPQWDTVNSSLYFLIWIFILPMSVIDLGGCIFWGVQPGDSVVDVLMSVPIWLFSHMDQCTLLIGVPSAGHRLLLIIDFQYIWVYMLVPTSCITLAPMFPLWKPLFLFCFVFLFSKSLCLFPILKMHSSYEILSSAFKLYPKLVSFSFNT